MTHSFSCTVIHICWQAYIDNAQFPFTCIRILRITVKLTLSMACHHQSISCKPLVSLTNSNPRDVTSVTVALLRPIDVLDDETVHHPFHTGLKPLCSNYVAANRLYPIWTRQCKILFMNTVGLVRNYTFSGVVLHRATDQVYQKTVHRTLNASVNSLCSNYTHANKS